MIYLETLNQPSLHITNGYAWSVFIICVSGCTLQHPLVYKKINMQLIFLPHFGHIHGNDNKNEIMGMLTCDKVYDHATCQMHAPFIL